MDIVFDIDGTLADASHRLHLIIPPDPCPPDWKKDWETFLSDEMTAKDAPMAATWAVLTALLHDHHQIIFITGRPSRQRVFTHEWLCKRYDCEHRSLAALYWKDCPPSRRPVLYMRRDGDRRPSSEVKRELLHKARSDGFNPVMVFEDRKDDTAMWRSEGLLCCQVAEGDY